MYAATLFLAISTVISQTDVHPLAAFKVGNIWYFINSDGTEMFPPQILDGVGSFSEGKFFVKKRNKDTSYFCYYDTKGNELFKVNTSLPFDFKSGRALTVQFHDEKGTSRSYGFIDDNGRVLYENILEDGLDFSDSLAYVQQGDNRGYIRRDGKIAFYIDDLHVGYRFSEGKAPISNNDYLFAFIDTTGKIVIPFKYDEVGEFSEGLCKAYYDTKFGYINHNGDFMINHDFDDAKNFREGYAFVATYDDDFHLIWGFINKDGRLMEHFIYRHVNDFSEGLASVNKNGKWGFVNYNADIVIDYIYSDADNFNGGIAFVADRENKKAGYINKKGEFVFEINKFDMLIDFRSNNRYYSFNNK